MPVFVQDTFTEASDVSLASHTGEIGASWTLHPQTLSGDLRIDAATDRVYSNYFATTVFYASGVPAIADVTIEYDMTVVSQSGNNGVAARIDTTGYTMYFVRYNYAGDEWQLYEQIDGVATLLDLASEALTVGQTYAVEFICTDASKELWVDGILKCSHSATNDITAAGRVGVRGFNVGSSSVGIHIDNFVASTGNVVATDFISSGNSLHEPSLKLDQTLSADFIASESNLYEPSVGDSGLISLDFIASGSALFEPSLHQSEVANATYNASWYKSPTYGANWYPPVGSEPTATTCDFILSGNVQYEPSVTSSIAISVDFIGSGANLYEPGLSIPDVAACPFIPSTEAVYEPSVIAVADQTLLLDYIVPTVDIYEPTLSADVANNIDGSSELVISTDYQSKTLYCSPDRGWFTID